MSQFALEYFFLVFIAASGVIQAAAAYSGLRGLWFFRSRGVTAAVGVALGVAAFLWFFLSGPRNLPDTNGGLDGTKQTGLFSAAAAGAIIFTLLLSSALNATLGKHTQELPWGLEALRETSFARALLSTVRRLWKAF
ncbi:MAG: hypothetical protein ACE5IG_00960 [Dehalococcoidia bacterium]